MAFIWRRIKPILITVTFLFLLVHNVFADWEIDDDWIIDPRWNVSGYPQNYEVTITNMDVENYVFAETKYYTFQAVVYDFNGVSTIDTVQIAFNDTAHWINASYDHQDVEWRLTSGNDYVTLKSGSGSGSGKYLTVTYPIYFKNTVLDALNVDIYMYANDTDGLECEWSEVATNYFNIQNLGGFAEYTFTGTGGKTVGGDVFELYAGGPDPSTFFEEDFESESLDTWGIYEPNATNNYVEISTVQFWSGVSNKFHSLHLVDAGSYITEVRHGVHRQTSFFRFTSFIYLEATSHCLSIKMERAVSTRDQIGPWVKFETDGKLYFVNATVPYDYYVMNYAADTWYNMTMIVNMTSDTYDLYVNEVLKNSTIAFFTAQSYLDAIVYSTYSGGVPTTETCDAYIDDIYLGSDPSGGYTGTAEAQISFEKLQHIHTQFAIGIPGGTTTTFNYADEGYIEFGIDYNYNDNWIENAWKVRLNITAGWVGGGSAGFFGIGSTGPKNYLQLEASWYEQDTYVKSDTLYALWEGGPGGLGTSTVKADYFRVWLDLWFNRINASTTYGGRINAYYYGMSDVSPWWSRWFSGADWQVMMDEVSQSMFFEDVKDDSGNIISSRSLDMMRVHVKVWRSNNYDFQLKLQDFDILNYKVAYQEMEGIDTPTFVATKIPQMPSTGFLASLWIAMSTLGKIITDALGPAMLNAWNAFVGFLDTVFAFTGNPTLFSDIMGWISSIGGWIADSFTYVVSALTSVMLLIGAFMGKFLNTLSTVFGIWVNMFTYFFAILDGTYSAGIAIWTDLGMSNWIVLAAILYPVWLLIYWEARGTDALLHLLKMHLDILMWFLNIFLSIIRLFLNLVGRIIESIPVVE